MFDYKPKNHKTGITIFVDIPEDVYNGTNKKGFNTK